MFTLKNTTVTKRKNGYEYRFRQQGYNKSFYGTTKEIAQEKAKLFLNELNKSIKSTKLVRWQATNGTLATTTAQALTPALDFFEKWFSQVKIHQVKEITYYKLYNKYKRYIKENIKTLNVEEINTDHIQKIINSTTPRNKEDIKSVFNQCLNYAIGCNKIKTNPCSYIKITKHIRENGKALSKEELHTFKEKIKSSDKQLIFLLFLYSGIRACEYSTLKIDIERNVIIVKNGKVKTGTKQTERLIPILRPLKAVITEIPQKLKENIKTNTIQAEYHSIMGGHLKDLRHTFATYCRKFVDNELVSIWQGHTLSNITASVYTHFDIEYQQEQASKIDY